MIIHGARPSPYVRKVIVFAAEKGLDVRVEPAGFGLGTPGYIEASPFGKIPALEHGEFRLSDSSAIVAYMDAVKPGEEMIPAEPKARAKAIWFEEFGDDIAQAVGGKIFFNRLVAPAMGRPHDLHVADRAETEELPKIYEYLEKALATGDWLVDARFTLADLGAACPLINISYVSKALWTGRWPRVARWLKAVMERPAVEAALNAEAPRIDELRCALQRRKLETQASSPATRSSRQA